MTTDGARRDDDHGPGVSHLNPTAMNLASLAVASLALLVAPQDLQGRWKTRAKSAPIHHPAQSNAQLPLTDQADTGRWQKWKPVWDEFDSAGLDSSKWSPGIIGWDGPQPLWYSPDNVGAGGGHLTLKLKYAAPPERLKGRGYHTYSGGAVTSKQRCLYGYYEVRAKAAMSRGSSTFWFHANEGPWWTEIDVFELSGSNPQMKRTMFVGTHVFRTPTETKHFNIKSTYEHDAGLGDAFHVYGLDWTAERIKFYFDGELVFDGPNTHWHQPLYLNMDHAILKGWFGLPEPNEVPSEYVVDYVHAWKRG